MSLYISQAVGEAKTLEDRFHTLDSARHELLDKARWHSAYTIPSLFPPEGHTDGSALPQPYSSKPSRNTVQLAAKLTGGVFPANAVPFFKIDLTNKGTLPPEQRQQVDEDFANAESFIMDKLRASNYRDVLYVAFQHLIVIGDVVLYQEDDYNFRVYRIDQFCIRRDGNGRVAELIVRDWLQTDLLPEDLKGVNDGNKTSTISESTRYGNLEPFYTHLIYNTETREWDVTREFRNVTVEEGVSYKHPPYYHVGWSRVYPEDYSRSLVEENFGDILSLDNARRALVEGVAAGSQGRLLVDPYGPTRAEDLETADNWAVVSGRQEDCNFLQPAVGNHLAVAQTLAQQLSADLDEAFLANAASQLTGERVTAFQVQESLTELEQALGGVLSQVAQAIQGPVVRRAMQVEVDNARFSPEVLELLEGGLLKIDVKTGLDALGRQLEGARLRGLLNDMAALPPEMQAEVAQSLRTRDLVRKLITTSGIDPDEILYTDEEIAERQAQQQQAALEAQASQQAISSLGAIAEQQAIA